MELKEKDGPSGKQLFHFFFFFFFFSSDRGSTIKGKSLLPTGANSFLLE